MLINFGLSLEDVRKDVLDMVRFGIESVHGIEPVQRNDRPAIDDTLASESPPSDLPPIAKQSPLIDPLRVLDAAANRAREGLRVVEDYVRFVLDDQYLTELCKQLRHDLTAPAVTDSYRQPNGRSRNASGRWNHVDHDLGTAPRRCDQYRAGQFRPLAGVAPQFGRIQQAGKG